MCTGFQQQLTDQVLRPVVISFSKMMPAYVTLRIDKVVCRPVLIIERLPDGVVVIQSHREILDPEVTHGALHIASFSFECKFRSVNPENDQAVILISFVPVRYVWQRAQTVDAGISPEVDQDDLASQGLWRERCGIQPRTPRRQEAGSPLLQQEVLRRAPCSTSWRRRSWHRPSWRHRSWRRMSLLLWAQTQMTLPPGESNSTGIVRCHPYWPWKDAWRVPVSHPNAMTTTAARTATPRPRRTHSPPPSEPFIAMNTRPP